MPLANTILMIRPAAFGFNEETKEDNFFQVNANITKQELQQRALAEFDNMVQILKSIGVDLLVIEDTIEPAKPDAIFPNNWLSTSPGGIVSIFSMYAPNRRTEKRADIIKNLKEKFIVKEVQDLSEYEKEGRFLEGTGSMVIDHDNKMIYASISERTNMPVLEKFVSTNNYQAIVFIATDKNGRHVYHTNIMMSIGENFAVLCEEAIDEEWELIAIRQLLESTGHTIISISREQMHCFAGNMLQVKNNKDEKFLIMSQAAYNSLRKEQKQMLEAYSQLIPIAVPTIEEVGGGGVRCMMVEMFLEKRT
ncbi:MAG: arginine deiminase-related protein [Chitinophagaceae bacterium]